MDLAYVTHDFLGNAFLWYLNTTKDILERTPY